MLETHLAAETEPLSWDEIYAGWEHDDFKYYWKDFNYQVAKRDESYAEKGFSEALDLARQGDERARVTLRRAIYRHPDSPGANAARDVLREIGVDESFSDS